MLSRARILAAMGLLVALAGYVLLLPPQKVGAIYLELCPMEIAGLPGAEVGLKEAVLDDLAPDGILSRRYERPEGLPVWLIIVYFENARIGLHDPHLCYRSQGYDLQVGPESPLDTDLGVIPLQSFRAVRGSRREQVYYFWYTAGRTALGEVKTFRDSMFFQGLKSNRSFGAFVRVSTLEGGDPEKSDRVLKDFVRELAPLLPSFFPETDPS